MSTSLLVSLRLLLGLLAAGVAVAAVFAPSFVLSVFGKPVGVALAVLLLGGALCVEIVLLSVWMLVSKAHDESIFDDRRHADRWVTLAIATLIAGALIGAVGFGYFLVAQIVDPSSATLAVLVVAGIVMAASAALALVVAVMRRLLHSAMQLRSELAEVI